MLGIYIHIPFCKQACNYCNFHFSTSLQKKNELISALVKDISFYRVNEETKTLSNKKDFISTLYFGGGTPSILDIEDLKIIFDALHKRFIFSDDIEITLEVNPDDITDFKLQQWKQLGVNRLSVGIQSFIENELIWMNRAHNANDSLICIDKIKAAGFTNFSVDLIYGSPLLSNEEWEKSIGTVIEKKIPHISCYALTVEPKTALHKLITTKKKLPIDAEKQATQFLLLMNWMRDAGYEHYEISNFAKPNFRSKHNSGYWLGKKYFGFGPSAHSFDGVKIRRWNIANNALYIKSLQNNSVFFEEEVLTITQQFNEYIMTALRTMEGISTRYISTKFGKNFSDAVTVQSKKYINTGKIKMKNENIILTNEGKLFADGIAVDLFI